MRDDIFPGGVENLGAPELAGGAKPTYAADPDRQAEEALRWSMAALLFQVVSILLFIVAWIPGVEWIFSACVRAGAGGQGGARRCFLGPLTS